MSRQGRHGESLFTTACTAPEAVAEATVNTSESDEHGWDHVVEIETPETARLPADLRSPLLTCFAQIKTTSTKTPKTVVKLSNAIKAAKSPAPSFVFLYHFADGHAPVLYGRHLWEEDIARILKRAREARDAPLHRKTVTFSFGEADRIGAPPPDWILGVLGGRDGMAYAEEKRRLAESVGYDEHPMSGTVTIGPVASAVEIVLHEIGLVEDLPFSALRMTDRRFGIETDLPDLSIEEGRISMTREGRPLTLRIASCDGKTIEAPAVGRAPLSVLMDHPAYRFRVTCGAIDLVCAFDGTSAVNISFGGEDPMPLPQLFALLAVGAWSTEGPVRIAAQVDEGELFDGQLDMHDEVEPWFRNGHRTAHLVQHLLGDRKCEDTTMTLAGFFNVMRNLHPLLTLHEGGRLRIEAVFDGGFEPFDALMGFATARVGEWTVGEIFELAVVDRRANGDRPWFEFGPVETIATTAFRRSLEATGDATRKRFDGLFEARTDRVARIGGGDIRRWLVEPAKDGIIEFLLNDAST